MSRKEAAEQYARALKAGQKFYKTAVNNGHYPYPQALDEIFDESMAFARVEIGLVDIPLEQIVGTKERGRQLSFAGNFMPLMEPDTEFGSKWINLCTAHLGDEGIRDPIRCVEYMGRFYVQEGNKRVSVLKSYGNPSIPGYVTRIVPAYSEDVRVRVYYEFMRFYKLSGLYRVQFMHPGSYDALQAALGFEPDHVWTQEERRRFIAGFAKLREALSRMGERRASVPAPEVLLVWLDVYGFASLLNSSAAEVEKELGGLWAEIENRMHDSPITVSTAPPEAEKGVLSALMGITRPTYLNAAFIYTAEPDSSPWIAAHEQGRKYLLEKMGDRVSAEAYVCTPADAFETMEKAIASGAELIFAATPPLMPACRRIAATYPSVKVLNCSLSMPYPGVRTYYGRVYEAKFVAGAIAGAMAGKDRIGYIADWPIFGVPASINAFTLGALAVNPRARVTLRWSCVEGDPAKELAEEGIEIVSCQDSAGKPRTAWDWGLYESDGRGQLTPLAAPYRDWGKFYVKVVAGVFSGAWSNAARENYRAVNYWWGLNSEVIGVKLGEKLPEGVKRLAEILRRGIADGSIDIFGCSMRDQAGILRSEAAHSLTPEEILNMDWLMDCVDGCIPAFDELKEESKGLVRILGIYRDKILPEKENIQL